MNKKTTAMTLVFLAMILNSAFAQTGADKAYPIEVTGTSFLPETIYAGDVVSLAVDIENTGSFLSVSDLQATLEIGNQFEGIEVDNSVDTIKKGTTKTLVFKFRAKEDTLPGYYPATVTMTYLRGDLDARVTATESITIPVAKTEKNLDVTLEPRVINPGNQTEVAFTIKNIGGTPVSNIGFSWEEENDLILPVGADNKRYVSVLTAGESAKVSYILAADPNIATGIYPLNIAMTFTDIDGTKTQESQIGLIVGGKTDFEISAEILSTGQLSISIANIGSNNADAVVVRIPRQEGISVSGSNASILGNLNKGDFTLANFQVRTTAMAGGRFPGTTQGAVPQQEDNARTVLLEIDYTDTTGERQSVQKSVELDFAVSDIITGTTGTMNGRFRQSSSGSSLTPWILLAAIAVGAVAIHKFWARKKNWKKLGAIIVIAIVLFLAAIFFLNSNTIALAAATVVSCGLLAWFFEMHKRLKKQKKSE
ncbi:MAG: COG1361 S-layer family protein [Candidatus Diapherotrites archaeon]|nr:COG1361 S-layer family protein [Candidatus Diapherotrites archaeon]